MILLQNISKAYGRNTLLKSISYHCPSQGRIALIGNNGAGKTTLLNILCGLDNDYEGSMIKPKALRLGYLPQIANPTPKDTILAEALSGALDLNAVIEERDAVLEQMAVDCDQKIFDRYERLEQQFQDMGGYRVVDDTKKILQGLGFKEEQFDSPVDILSGGWRMRLEFVKMLLNKPNFLILDEPTNHLDLPTILWFEDYLKRFEGTILFVSHDKDLLNRLSTHVLHLKQGEMTPYVGNFDAFLEAFSLKQSQQDHMAKQLRLQAEHIEKFVNTFRATPTKAKQVQSRLKMLSRLRMLEDTIEIDELKDTMNLSLRNPYPSSKEVMKVEDLRIGYDKPLTRAMSFTILRGQKIGILGANGLGKSTLLKTLLGTHPPVEGRVSWGLKFNAGYFAQEHLEGLNEELSILENVTQSSSDATENEARGLLGSLGLTGEAVFKKIKILSGGEKSRVALASMLIKRPNVLFLDEPTNHLDLSACENLANALSVFTGTVIFVSHNRAFIHEVATHQIYLTEKGQVRLESVEHD